MIVVDASITMSWLIADEARPDRDAVYARIRAEGAVAPSLWCLEIANVLRVAVRRSRIGIDDRNAALDLLRRMDIAIRPDIAVHAWTSVLTLADRHDLTPYDAAYLDLALRERLPLATVDRALALAARAEGVPVLP